MNKKEYYFKVVNAVRQRSTCDRGKTGAILVRDEHIISTGYVGSPSGTSHCDQDGHLLEKHGDTVHCVRTVHAELNAILQAAKYGPPVDKSTLYSWIFPCYNCAKALVNAGIIRVYSMYDYHRSEESKKLLDIKCIPWEIEKIDESCYDTGD